MSRFLHSMCVACWNERNPMLKRIVPRLAEHAVPCCYCDEPTGAAFLIGMIPGEAPCKGIHFDTSEGGDV